MCSTPWFPLTQHALTFLSSLSLLFPSLHLLPPPPLCENGHLFTSPTTFAQIARRQPAAAGTLFAGAHRLRQTEQRRAATRRAAYGGSKRRPRRSGGSPPRAWPARPLRSKSRPRRPSGLPPRAWPTQAAPVLKSTWPTRPVATAGDADQAAPVLPADQAHTTAAPALPMFLPRIHTRPYGRHITTTCTVTGTPWSASPSPNHLPYPNRTPTTCIG